MMNSPTPSQWRAALNDKTFDFTARCGSADTAPRKALIEKVLGHYAHEFGDTPVRLFRSPGRINLRGMHVDTHGGFLNLMTHQREVVVAAASASDQECTCHNIDPQFQTVTFSLDEESKRGPFTKNWMDYIVSEGVEAQRATHSGDWRNYVTGAVLRARYDAADQPFQGIHAVVGSDIPRGAALSSSHALCVALNLAALSLNGYSLDDYALIRAARGAEWYAGARSGTSDQGAMILGRPGQVVHAAILAEDLESTTPQYIDFPDNLAVLAIHSHTHRNLSGPQLVAYTANRFAYSMAMEILRQELCNTGWSHEEAARLDRLSRMTPEALGGDAAIFQLLQRIPETASLETLRQRYALPDLEEAYTQCFGGVPEAARPTEIGLRGPLLFGLAESERARVFFQALQEGDGKRAGQTMTIGHQGDRVQNADGSPRHCPLDDTTLKQWHAPLWQHPGDYRASSPILDGIVDAALQAGALGACLTGAGMAGTVLALCPHKDLETLQRALRQHLGSQAYAQAARLNTPLRGNDLEEAVMVNAAPQGAGEIVLV
jgi:galactokinase